VKRALLRTGAFIRAAKHLVKRTPEVAEPLARALERLADDAADPRLKTHKLKGDLDGCWACSVGYDVRVVFRLVDHQGSEAILLESVGTHDEVY